MAGVELNKKRGQFSIREQFPVEMETKRKRLYPVMRKYQQNSRNKVALVRDKLYVNGQLYDEDTGDHVRSTKPKSNSNDYQPEFREHSAQRFTDDYQEGPPRRILKANRPSVSFEHKNSFELLSEPEANLTLVNEATGTKRKPTSPALNETLAKKAQQIEKARDYSDDDSIADMEAGQITVSADVHHSASNETDNITTDTGEQGEHVTTGGEVFSSEEAVQGDQSLAHRSMQDETSLTATSNLIVSSMQVNTIDPAITAGESADFHGVNGTSSTSFSGTNTVSLNGSK